MTPTIFKHYFRCNCGLLLSGLTGETVFCTGCDWAHSLGWYHIRVEHAPPARKALEPDWRRRRMNTRSAGFPSPS